MQFKTTLTAIAMLISVGLIIIEVGPLLREKFTSSPAWSIETQVFQSEKKLNSMYIEARLKQQ